MPPRRSAEREERLAAIVQSAQLAAVRTVRGLFRQPGAPGYNHDAGATWKECRTVTRAALILTQGVMAAERAKSAAAAAPASFNVVVLPQQIDSAKDWAAFARQKAAQAARPALEAAVVAEEPKK